MTIKRLLLSIAAPIALLGVSGCATNFQANVQRFQRLPAPQGQTFRIEASDPHNRGGLEFATYAREVAAHLTQVRHAALPRGRWRVAAYNDGTGAPGERITMGEAADAAFPIGKVQRDGCPQSKPPLCT